MRDVSILHDLIDEGAAKALAARERNRTFRQFLTEEIHTDMGPWALEGHEPLAGIVDLMHQIVIERIPDAKIAVAKGEQLGLSTAAIGLATWLPAELGHNVGYFLPTDKMADEFGASRFNPIVDKSPLLAAAMEDAMTDRGQLKEINGKHLRVLGLEARTSTHAGAGDAPLGAVASPMDAQLFDEVDFIPRQKMNWARGRLSHSPLRLQIFFSAPYAPGRGIDQRFESGSQRKWVVRCNECAREQVLEETFPECVRKIRGAWRRVCDRCRKPVDVAKDGRWVASEPEREAQHNYSFRLSQLSMTSIDLGGIMQRYEDAQDDPEEMAIFNRSVRALPDAGALQPFTDAVLRSMQRPYSLILAPGAHPRFFGVDTGNACWFWCEEWIASEGRPRLVWAEKINSDHLVERVSRLIDILQPQFGIIDAHPLLAEARKLAYSFPRRVAVQNFVGNRELTMTEQTHVVEGAIGGYGRAGNPKYLEVTIDRNDALAQFCADAAHPEHGLVIPDDNTKQMTLVKAHLKKLQKELVKASAGNEVYRFLDNVENHFGMAACSARLARLVTPSPMPFSWTPAETGTSSRATSNRWKGALLGG